MPRTRTYRDHMIFIRCSESTLKKWRKTFYKLKAAGKVNTYEDLLNLALDLVRNEYFPLWI